MNKRELTNNLTTSLAQMYDMEVIGCLSDFLQGELHVLNYLSQNKNMEINPSILSDNIHVSRSRITAALATLRKKNYVTMEMSQEDRRRMCVLLTPQGEAFIKEKHNNVENYFHILVEGLGEQNVMEMTRLIKLSIEIMENKENLL